jgi:hypothetical protein
MAAQTPAIPPPTTTTSVSNSLRVRRRLGSVNSIVCTPPDASAKLSAPNDNAIGLAIVANHRRRVMSFITPVNLSALLLHG